MIRTPFALTDGRATPDVVGVVITPGHPEYDAARTVWNAMVDRRPSHVVRCADTEDVRRTLVWARSTGLDVTVRGGGHGIPGHSVIDDGVVVDLADLNGVFVDPVTRTARVGGGCLLGDLDRATQVHGLMTPAGAVSHIGIGGLTLGGGSGWTMRKFGLTIDNLLSTEVVLADGQVVRASATSHPELFWALRGGGGNFGVVTEFEFVLHEIGPLHLAANVFHVADASTVLRAMREFMPTAPDELAWSACFRRLPAWPWAPAEHVGEPVLLAPLAWVGDAETGRRVVDSLTADLARRGAEPLAAGHGPIEYVSLQSLNDELTSHGHRNHCRSAFLRDLGDATIEVLCARGAVITSANSQLEVLSTGGAVNRVDPSATAYAHRGELWPVNVWGTWRTDEDDAANIRWVEDSYAALTPHLRSGPHHNVGGSDADVSETRDNFGATWQRLRAVKSLYDPNNVFRHCANVPPL